MPETRVVHVNSQEWKDTPESNRIYIGRAMPRRGFKASFWQNMNRITDKIDRTEAIARFEYDLENSEWHKASIRELRGKVLGCWCHPEACHGDVLARLANMSEAEFETWLKSKAQGE